jgi:hypothetical protein
VALSPLGRLFMMGEPIRGDRAGIKRTATPDARSERAICEYRNHRNDEAAGYPRHMSGSKVSRASSGVPLAGDDRSVGAASGDTAEPTHGSPDVPSRRR